MELFGLPKKVASNFVNNHADSTSITKKSSVSGWLEVWVQVGLGVRGLCDLASINQGLEIFLFEEAGKFRAR